jgi:Tol biopolymer transport system component
MQPSRFISPFFARAGLLVSLLCIPFIGLSALIGHGTPRRSVAFVSGTDRILTLRLMDVQRGIAQPISDVPIYSCCLDWSPDGTKIAFGANNNHVYVVDAYGGETRLLSPPDWRGWIFGWADDGQRVILGTMSLSSGDLYRIDADGENFELLAKGSPDKMVLSLLSPDGLFAFYAQRQSNTVDWTLNRLNLEDGSAGLFIGEGWDGSQVLALSPDGQRAAYALPQRHELLLMNADGSDVRRLSGTDSITSVVWSPDSQQILVEARDVSGVQAVYITDADGENPRDLGLKGQFGLVGDFSWSPDGTQIVFMGMARGQKPDLYVMDADGKNVQRLTLNPGEDKFPVWQPQP